VIEIGIIGKLQFVAIDARCCGTAWRERDAEGNTRHWARRPTDSELFSPRKQRNVLASMARAPDSSVFEHANDSLQIRRMGLGRFVAMTQSAPTISCRPTLVNTCHSTRRASACLFSKLAPPLSIGGPMPSVCDVAEAFVCCRRRARRLFRGRQPTGKSTISPGRHVGETVKDVGLRRRKMTESTLAFLDSDESVSRQSSCFPGSSLGQRPDGVDTKLTPTDVYSMFVIFACITRCRGKKCLVISTQGMVLPGVTLIIIAFDC
jgi:hypothetical protein